MVRVELGLRDVLLVLGLLAIVLLAYLLRDVVVLLAIAFMLTAVLTPLVDRIQRATGSRTWAVAAVMLGFVLLPMAAIALIAPLLVSEFTSLGRDVPAFQGHVDLLLRHLGLANRVNDAIAKANLNDRIGGIALVSARQTVNLLVQAITVVVITGYLLADGPRLRLSLHEFVPRQSERHIDPLLHGMQRVVGGYIRGQLLTSVLFGVFAFLFCLVLRVPSPLLLGVIAAVGDVIPIFGVPAAMILAALFAFTHSTWQPLAVLAGYVLYSQLESHLLVPRIYSRTVNLSPLLVILATIGGAAADGILGILIGIPLVGVLKVIFDYIVAERRRSREEAAIAAGGGTVAEDRVEGPGAPEADVEAHDPRPTVSPFEPLPDATDAAPFERDVSQAASARILRLEEEVARLAQLIVEDHQGQEAREKLRAVP